MTRPEDAELEARRRDRNTLLGRWDWIGIAASAAVLIGVCLIAGVRRPFFWYDELITHLEIADPSFVHMVLVIARGLENNPPLYQILLRGWSSIAGDSPNALRLMSALCVAGAIAVMWRAMRRELAAPAVAVALGLTFFRADALLDQVAQARQYGLFLLAAALAIYAALEVLRSDRVGPALWLGTFGAHVLLLYTHTFGVLFSGAIGAAMLCVDAMRGRFRPVALSAVAVAWLAFAPWVPHMLAQGRMTEPRMWIPRPGFSRLTGVLQRLTSLLSFVVVAAGLVAAFLARRARQRELHAGTRFADGRFALVAVGIAVAAVAPAVWVESRIARPIFVDRYVIASALGWPLLVGVALDGLFRRWSRRLAPAGGAAFAALGAAALIAAARRETQTPQDIVVPPSVAGVPAIAESALHFLPLRTYGASTRRYHFPLDWELALDPTNAAASVQDYKLMALAVREGYLGPDVVDGARWLATTDRFLVVDTPEHLWFERRVRTDPAWSVSEAGRYGEAARVWLVRRIATNSAAATITQSTP